MNAWAVIVDHPPFFYALAAVLGLLVGSFLNVLAYRLPVMLERQWQREAQEVLGLPQAEHERFDLCLPASRCPHCQRPIRAWENIPVLSYLALRGRCAGCKARISARYPLVELASALLSLLVAWHFGPGVAALAVMLLTWGLIGLSLIDAEHQLLPDVLVLPLLWLGLVVNAFRVAGAAGRCGMGRGGGLPEPVDGVLGVQAGDRQGGHGLWRLQAAGHAGCLGWLAGFAADLDAGLLGGGAGWADAGAA